MKKTFTIVLVILILLLVGIWKINKDYYTIWNANTISVRVEAPLDIDCVKIEFGVSINYRTLEKPLKENDSSYIYVFDGVSTSPITNEYGENDFIIVYDNEYLYQFRHFKKNANHQHNYYISLFKDGNRLFISINIKGKDALKLEGEMLEIRNLFEYSHKKHKPIFSINLL